MQGRKDERLAIVLQKGLPGRFDTVEVIDQERRVEDLHVSSFRCRIRSIYYSS